MRPKNKSRTTNAAATPSRFRSELLIGVAAIAIATVVVYWPSLNGQFIWDDETLITNNMLVKAPDGLYRFWLTTDAIDYWPLTNSTFWIEWRLWGTNPTGYHVDNLILHTACSLLIWMTLKQLSIPGAFLAALLFAVHPVNVESVAWIAPRKNTLAMVLFLISIYCYLKVDDSNLKPGATGAPERRWWSSKWYLLSLAAFVLAMLSKGSVAILPGVLLLIAWWRRNRISTNDLVRIGPFMVVGVALVGVDIWFQTHGSIEAIRSVEFAERLAGAGAIIWFYLLNALVPVQLMFVYPQLDIRPSDAISWVPLAAALGATALLTWQRNRWWGRPVLFAWIYFCLALTPVMGFVDVYYMKYSLVADHYEHLALVGVVSLAAACWATVARSNRAALRQTAMTTAALAVMILMVMCWKQSRLFDSGGALYEDTLEKNPDSWLAHNNLGQILNDLGRSDEAERHLQAALRINPDNVDIYYNLGNSALKQGKPADASAWFQKALDKNSNYTQAQNNLALSLLQMGRVSEAVARYRQVVQAWPDYCEAHFNLGAALMADRQIEDAIVELKAAIKLNVDFFPAHARLGDAYCQNGNLPAAIDEYQAALRLFAGDPQVHNNLGIALSSSGSLPEAISQFEEAVRINPDYAEAWGNMAASVARLGRHEQARLAAQKALELATAQGKAALVDEVKQWLREQERDLQRSSDKK